MTDEANSDDKVVAILRAIMEIVERQQARIDDLEQTLDDLHFVYSQQMDKLHQDMALAFTTREIVRYSFGGSIQELSRAFFRLCYFLPESIAAEILKLSPGIAVEAPYQWLPSVSDEQYEIMRNLLIEGDLMSDTFFGEAVTRNKRPDSDTYEPPLIDRLARLDP